MARQSYAVDDALEMVLAEDSLSVSSGDSDIIEDPDFPLPDANEWSDTDQGTLNGIDEAMDDGMEVDSGGQFDGLEVDSEPESNAESECSSDCDSANDISALEGKRNH